MGNKDDLIRKVIVQIDIFQKHPHPVVHVLMKGFSRVMVREAFSMTRLWDAPPAIFIPPVRDMREIQFDETPAV